MGQHPGGLLQIRMPQAGELRYFNPERDMVWSLPRIIKRAFEQLGDIDAEKYQELLKSMQIIAPSEPPERQLELFGEAIIKLKEFFNTLGGESCSMDISAAAFETLFLSIDKAALAVLSGLITRCLFAELPLWFEQVRPRTKVDPQPPIDEINASAAAVLQRLYS